MDLVERAKKIKLLVLDVDGVLTKGQVFLDSKGEALKVFHTQDGLGIAAAGKVGLHTAIITGRTSDMVRLRAAELKIADIYQGSTDKLTALHELLEKAQLTLAQVAYVGDDLNDQLCTAAHLAGEDRHIDEAALFTGAQCGTDHVGQHQQRYHDFLGPREVHIRLKDIAADNVHRC